jgi:hypothetical protein
MALSGAVAVAGVVILSRFHPDAQTNAPKVVSESLVDAEE